MKFTKNFVQTLIIIFIIIISVEVGLKILCFSNYPAKMTPTRRYEQRRLL